MTEKNPDIKERHGKLKEEFEALRSARQLIERQWVVNYLTTFTRDKYILKVDGSIARLSTGGNDKEKLYARITKLLPIYRSMFSKIYKQSPLFRVEPDGLDAEDERGTDLAEAIITQDYQKWKRAGLLSKTIMWFLITGNSFTKLLLKKDVGDFVGLDEDKKVVYSGELEVVNVVPFNLYFKQSYDINTVADAKRTFEVILLDKEFAKDTYKLEDTEGAVEDSLKTKILLSGDYLDVEGETGADNYREVILVTEQKTKKNPKGAYTLMTNERIITEKNDGNPWPDAIGNQYAQAKMIETGLGLGVSTFDFSTQIDRQINLYRGQLNDHAEKLSNPILALPQKSSIESVMIADRRVKVIFYDTRYGEPKFMQPTEFASYFGANASQWEQDLMDVNAIHESSQAKRPTGVKSGIAMAYLGEQDDMQHAPMVDSYFLMLETIGRKYLETKKDFFDDDEMDIKIYGNDNIRYTKYKGKQLKGNTNLRIVVNTGLPMNRIARQQVLMELGAAKIIPPSTIRQLLEFGELDAIFKEDVKDTTRQYMENELLLKGEPVTVKVEDNHIVHIKVIVSFAKTSHFLELKEEIKTGFFEHISAHIKQMVKTFDESPLLASMVIKTQNLDPDIMSFIQSEIDKTAALKAKKAQNAGAGEQPQPQPQGQGGPYPAGGPTANDIQAAMMQNQNGMPPQAADLQATAEAAAMAGQR